MGRKKVVFDPNNGRQPDIEILPPDKFRSEVGTRLNPDAYIWERLVDETDTEYNRFSLFLSLNTERSLSQVARLEGVAVTVIHKIAKDNRWIDRAKAYDQHQLERLKHIDATNPNDETKVWNDRRKAYKTRTYSLSEELFQKAKSMLALPITETITTTETSKDGKTIINNHIHPLKWTIADITRMISVADELARNAINMPTELYEFRDLVERKGLDFPSVLRSMLVAFSEMPDKETLNKRIPPARLGKGQ